MSCRKVRAWLSDKGIEIEERDYFKNPFSITELQDLLEDLPPADLFSWRSPAVKKMGLNIHHLNDKDLLELMIQEPRLIRRPIIKIGKKLFFGADFKILETVFSS